MEGQARRACSEPGIVTGPPRLVGFDVADGIGRLTLDRADKGNALDPATAAAFLDALHTANELATNGELRAMVVASTSADSFCAGADLSARRQMTTEQLSAHTAAIARITRGLYDAPYPVVCAISGWCLGAGLEIALGCDFRIATPDATLGFPEVRVGVFPGAGGIVLAPRLIGTQAARRMIYGGQRVDGVTAHGMGLVDELADSHGHVLQRAAAMAADFAAGPPLALRAAKEALNYGAALPVPDAWRLADSLRAPLNWTADHREGIAAFAERRAPTFTGRMPGASDGG